MPHPYLTLFRLDGSGIRLVIWTFVTACRAVGYAHFHRDVAFGRRFVTSVELGLEGGQLLPEFGRLASERSDFGLQCGNTRVAVGAGH